MISGGIQKPMGIKDVNLKQKGNLNITIRIKPHKKRQQKPELEI